MTIRGRLCVVFPVVVAGACVPSPPDMIDLTLVVDAPASTCWEVFSGAGSYTPGVKQPGTQFRCGSDSVGFETDLVAAPTTVRIKITEGSQLEAELVEDGNVVDRATLGETGDSDVLSR